MTPGRVCRFLAKPGALLRAAGVALLLVVGATPAMAQADLEGAEAGYQTAHAAYEDRLADLRQAFSLYERAQEEVDLARGGSDPSRQERAFATFRVRAIELMELEAEVEEAASALSAARGVLLSALEARETELLERLDEETNAANRTALQAEWERVRRRTLAVEPETGLEEGIVLQPVPELTVDPRDGPTELREKAGFLEEKAVGYDSLVVSLGRDIAERERRMQVLRGREDLVADLSRFDSDLLPGGRLGPRPASAPAQEETGSDGVDRVLAQLPLSEQVELLASIREQAVQYRDRALAQAELFREHAEGTVP